MSDLSIFEKLDNFGRNVFIKLCDLGCDPRILDDYFGLLPALKLPPRTIGPREAKQIAGRAERALADITFLEKQRITELMFPFPADDDTPLDDDTAHSEVFYAILVLQEIAALPQFMKEVWPSRNPEYVSYLSAIYNHVHAEIEHWNDEFVADILNALFPDPTTLSSMANS